MSFSPGCFLSQCQDNQALFCEIGRMLSKSLCSSLSAREFFFFCKYTFRIIISEIYRIFRYYEIIKTIWRSLNCSVTLFPSSYLSGNCIEQCSILLTLTTTKFSMEKMTYISSPFLQFSYGNPPSPPQNLPRQDSTFVTHKSFLIMQMVKFLEGNYSPKILMALRL